MKNRKILLFASLAFIFIVLGSFVLVKKINLKDSTTTQKTTEVDNRSDFEKLTDILSTIYKGKVSYTNKYGDVDVFTTGLSSFNDVDVSASHLTDVSYLVYKYIPGKSKFDSGYEGFEWERNLDDDVAVFNNLKIGVQNAIFYQGAMGSDQKTRIELRKIGTKNYSLVDGYFQPAMTWTRYYYTFDDENNQLVYIMINFFFGKNEVIRDVDYKVEYPQEVVDFLSDFEENVLAVF